MSARPLKKEKVPMPFPRAHGTVTIDLGNGPHTYALVPLEDMPAEAGGTAPASEADDEEPDVATPAELAALRAFEEEYERTGGRPLAYPLEIVRRLCDEEEPRLTVMCDFRGMTQADLARATGLAPAFLSQLASGKRKGSLATWRRIAKALDLPLDELVEENPRQAPPATR
jgi:DNA-binding Xre family transcriptional regulator